jgi:dihydrofolate synthase/folylpolyglutamate synthase
MVAGINYDDYRSVTEYLFSRLPVFQRTGPASYKIDLETTRRLDDYFENPHQNYPAIHIAGTNGKGSVSHMLASVLQEAGYRTGLYTSPHLKDFRERIRINGNPVPEDFVKAFVKEYDHLFSRLEPSFFEITVAMAFRYFSEEKVDIAVIETGLGGRLDSTNIITPLCSVITNIGMDHMHFLGNTLESIAREKAGIIKEGIPVVVGRYQTEIADLFREIAAHKHSPLFFAEKEISIDIAGTSSETGQEFIVKKGDNIIFSSLQTDLFGNYQKENTVTALKTIEILKEQLHITDKDIRQGMKKVVRNTGLQGRWQVLRQHPLIVCDTGHNSDAFLQLTGQIKKSPYKNLFMVLGFVNDKNLHDILDLLPREAYYLFTRAGIPRAMDPDELQKQALQHGLTGQGFPTVEQAVKGALSRAGKDDMIFIGGSTFVVAEVI